MASAVRDNPVVEDAKANKLQSLADSLWVRKRKWEDRFKDIGDLVIPVYEDIEVEREPGEEQGKEMFDTTAANALEVFTNGFYGNMVNPAIRWFRLIHPIDKLNDLLEVAAYFEAVEEEMYAALRNSNFYKEIFPFIKAGASIGTSIMTIFADDKRDSIVYSNLHPQEFAIGEGDDKKVSSVSRRVMMSLEQFVGRFGKDALPDELRQPYKENPYAEIRVENLVMPRENFDATTPTNINMPFASVWMYNGKIVSEGGFETFPHAVWRYATFGREIYGRSPAIQMLPTIRTLNTIAKDLLKHSQLVTNPPMNIPNELEGMEDITPFGFNYYSDKDNIVRPIPIGGNFPIGIDREEKYQQSVNEAYQVQFFLLLASAEREMTATEVLEKRAEKAAILGPAIGRFTWEALDNIMDRTFSILQRQGKFPEPPGILLEQGGDLQWDYLGPLAQAQKSNFSVNGLMRALQTAQPVMAAVPETMDNVNFDEATRELMQGQGAPTKVIRSRAEVRQRREAQAKLQREQAQAEQANLNADTLGKAAKADKDLDGKLSQAAEEVFSG